MFTLERSAVWTGRAFGRSVPAELVAGGLAGKGICGPDCACDGGTMSIAMQKIMNSIVLAEREGTRAAAAILKTLGITRAV